MKEKFDLLYVFNYEAPFLESAISRFRCSLKSISGQEVSICVYNYSSECIYDCISDIMPGIKYQHTHYKGLFSRSLLINHAVKKLIRSHYFILSDVDVVYSKDHIQRLKQKMNMISNPDDKLRVVTYNYNLAPVYKNIFYNIIYKIPFVSRFIDQDLLVKPHFYTHDYTILDQFRKEVAGYAHGLGVIHTQSFFDINGYDEELIGHGPEDAIFNTRIGKINRLIYDNLPDTATFHLWHPKFHRIQVSENLRIYNEKQKFYDGLEHATCEDVRANKNKSDWGIL